MVEEIAKVEEMDKPQTPETDNLEALSVKDLRAMAIEKGVTVRAGAKKADIVSLIRESEGEGENA